MESKYKQSFVSLLQGAWVYLADILPSALTSEPSLYEECCGEWYDHCMQNHKYSEVENAFPFVIVSRLVRVHTD